MKDELTSVWEGSQSLQWKLHMAIKETCELKQTNKVLHVALADITNGRGHKRVTMNHFAIATGDAE